MTCQGQHPSWIQIAHILKRTLGRGLGKL